MPVPLTTLAAREIYLAMQAAQKDQANDQG